MEWGGVQGGEAGEEAGVPEGDEGGGNACGRNVEGEKGCAEGSCRSRGLLRERGGVLSALVPAGTWAGCQDGGKGHTLLGCSSNRWG